MKMMITGCVLIFLAVVVYLALTLIPQNSPNPLVEATLNVRAAQVSLGVGVCGALLVALGLYRGRRD